MSEGYLYCFSNPSMPGILKIGMTERLPTDRLLEANASDTWRPPTQYTLEFAKKVTKVKQKERTLHKLLEQYTERPHPRREFFKVSLAEVRVFFELMDGELWIPQEEQSVQEEEEEPQMRAGCREMSKCFTDGQRIRHTNGITDIWEGIYSADRDAILCNGQVYPNLNKFVHAHLKSSDSVRRSINGWAVCETFLEGAWSSTYNLPPL